MDNQRLRLLIEEARTTQKEIAASLGLSHQGRARRTMPTIYMKDGLFVLALPIFSDE